MRSSRSRCWQVQFLMKPFFRVYRWWCSSCVFMWQRERERERESESQRVSECSNLFSSSSKDTNSIKKAPSLWPHLSLITSRRPLTPNAITLRVRGSKDELRGETFSPSQHHTDEFKWCTQIRSDQSLSRVWLFVTPWIAAHQASLSNTNSRRMGYIQKPTWSLQQCFKTMLNGGAFSLLEFTKR